MDLVTDHLAAAITSHIDRPRVGIVAEINRNVVDGADYAGTVQVGEQVINCVDECVNWRHEVGDPVSLEWGDDGTCYVVRPLARRPHQGTVTKVETFTNSVNVTFTDVDGTAWQGNVVGTTPAVGDGVEVMWTVQGAMCAKALWWSEGMHPDMTMPWAATAPEIQTSGLPGIVPTAPDQRFDTLVQAVQSGTIRDGAWRMDGASDRLVQGAQTALENPSMGVWLFGGGLDFLSGRIITGLSVELRRLESGRGAVPITFRLHDARTTADTPAWVGDPIPGPVLHPGETADFALPPAALGPIVSGAAHGIGVVGDGWCEIAGIGTTVTSGRLHITSRLGDTVTAGGDTTPAIAA